MRTHWVTNNHTPTIKSRWQDSSLGACEWQRYYACYSHLYQKLCSEDHQFPRLGGPDEREIVIPKAVGCFNDTDRVALPNLVGSFHWPYKVGEDYDVQWCVIYLVYTFIDTLASTIDMGVSALCDLMDHPCLVWHPRPLGPRVSFDSPQDSGDLCKISMKLLFGWKKHVNSTLQQILGTYEEGTMRDHRWSEDRRTSIEWTPLMGVCLRHSV